MFRRNNLPHVVAALSCAATPMSPLTPGAVRAALACPRRPSIYAGLVSVSGFSQRGTHSIFVYPLRTIDGAVRFNRFGNCAVLPQSFVCYRCPVGGRGGLLFFAFFHRRSGLPLRFFLVFVLRRVCRFSVWMRLSTGVGLLLFVDWYIIAIGLWRYLLRGPSCSGQPV